MALLFLEGFENGSASKFDEGVGSFTVSSSNGRFGSYGAFGSGSALTKWLAANTQTIIAGTGFKFAATTKLWDFIDNATIQVHIDLSAANVITVYRGSGTSNVLGSYTHTLGNLTDSIYRQWQAKVKIHGSTGTVEVKMNGVSVITLTGLNTQATGNAYVTKVATYSAGSGAPIDDIYLADDSGVINNDFLGDVRALPIFPNAVGATTNWTRGGTSHSNNWESVDEVPANGDTDYVATANAGDIDTYGMTDLSISSGSVLGVQWEGYLRKDDAGSRTACPVIHSGGADHLGSNFLPLDSYTYFWQMFNTDPQDGAAWDISRVNAVQLGQKLVS